jgi:uncharacterized secreted repeat protein (TIGR03808 family)
MDLDRRYFLAAAAAGSAAIALPARAAPLSNFGLDAAHFGVRPGAESDQSGVLQRAIDEAAKTRAPLMLAPGVYRAGDLKLPAGSQLSGVRGGTRLMLTQGVSLLSAEHADTVTLSGLMIDGGKHPTQEGRGLVHFDGVKATRIDGCEITGAGANGVTLLGCTGEVTHTTITEAADNAVFCNDSAGLLIAFNSIAKSGNGGIRVWQSVKRRDGSLIADNSIDDTAARAGGDGQNGNAINVFRAADVIVRGNHIRNAAFSAIRGNAASNIQILGNNCAGLDEVAIYSEFDFEGAVIADNVIDGAAFGVSVTNFKEGGRLAVVKGNLIRNLTQRRPQGGPDAAGVGIGVEADTAVTGNVIENAQTAGIIAGWGQYLRDVTVSGNVVRASGIGVAVSVSKGAGTAVISDNTLARLRRGAIIGMDLHKVVTGDLALAGAERYPNLRISGNQVS